MTAWPLQKAKRAIGPSLAVALALILSGCAPETTFAGFSDEQLKDLFPTEAEVASAVPGKVSLSDPIVSERTPASPGDSTATLPTGVPENCRDTYLGTDETRAVDAAYTRSFKRDGRVDNHRLGWSLTHFPSEAEAKRFLDVYQEISKKCENYSMFDLDVQSGWGRTASPDGIYEGISAIVSVGDVTISVSLTDFSKDEGEAVAKKMASAMERRINASNPTK